MSKRPNQDRLSLSNSRCLKRPSTSDLREHDNHLENMDQVKKELKELMKGPLVNRSFMAHEPGKKPRKRLEKNKKATVSMNPRNLTKSPNRSIQKALDTGSKTISDPAAIPNAAFMRTVHDSSQAEADG